MDFTLISWRKGVVAVIQFHFTDFTSSNFDSDFDFQLDSWTALDIPGLPYEKRLRIGEKIFIDFHMKSPLVHLFVASAHWPSAKNMLREQSSKISVSKSLISKFI